MTHAERLKDIGNRLAGSVMDPQARELYAIAAALEAERVVAKGVVQVVEYNDSDGGGTMTIWTDGDPGDIEGKRIHVTVIQ